MSIALNSALPVGTVVPWAGNDADAVASLGWLHCNGQAVAQSDYPDLYLAIKMSNGRTSPGTFCVPDLRGRFPRCVDDGAGRDPNAGTREAAAEDGNSGDAVGSVQGFATGLPRNPFKATVRGLPPESYHKAYAGTTLHVASRNTDKCAYAVVGGDRETRPVNSYLHFIIKAKAVGDGRSPVTLPPAAVVGFAGTDTSDPDASMVRCDGTGLSPTGIYAEVFDYCGTSFGGNSDRFCVPDLRGRFVRGVTEKSSEDPQPGLRQVPRPELPAGQQGAAGNHTGSFQPYATALPVQVGLTVTLKGIPTSSYDSSYLAGPSTARWNDGEVTVSVTPDGGDPESCPVNVAIDLYLRAGGDTTGHVPVGTVIGCAGPLAESTPEDIWVPCDGRSLPLSDPALTRLREVLDGNYGEDEETFSVPDYRGRFLRGTDAGSGHDAGAAARLAHRATGPSRKPDPSYGVGSVQDWLTGRPSDPFTITVEHLPTDYDSVSHTFPWSHKVINWVSSGVLVPFDTDQTGDSETRPPNLYLYYLIKARSTGAEDRSDLS